LGRDGIRPARELRDRWLEQVNGAEAREHVPRITGKYDIRRQIAETQKMPTIEATPVRLLEAA
jgi:hypothetical protein